MLFNKEIEAYFTDALFPYRLQFEDIQQSRICSIVIAISFARIRSCVSIDSNVYDQNEFCKRLGSGISSANRDVDSLLDRVAFKWSITVAR